MLFISRRYLCVYKSNKKLDVVEKRDPRELLEARSSNTIYFKNADSKLYSMVSYGDTTFPAPLHLVYEIDDLALTFARRGRRRAWLVAECGFR